MTIEKVSYLSLVLVLFWCGGVGVVEKNYRFVIDRQRWLHSQARSPSRVDTGSADLVCSPMSDISFEIGTQLTMVVVVA